MKSVDGKAGIGVSIPAFFNGFGNDLEILKEHKSIYSVLISKWFSGV